MFFRVIHVNLFSNIYVYYIWVCSWDLPDGIMQSLIITLVRGRTTSKYSVNLHWFHWNRWMKKALNLFILWLIRKRWLCHANPHIYKLDWFTFCRVILSLIGCTSFMNHLTDSKWSTVYAPVPISFQTELRSKCSLYDFTRVVHKTEIVSQLI